MDNVNTNAKESRKKYLAPLLVLLLCAVSLTGAAYAYTSSVTVIDNQVDSNEFVLQVYDNQATPALISAPQHIKVMDLGHDTQIGATSTTTVMGYAEPVATFVGMLTLKDTTVTTGDKAVAITFTVPFTGTEGKDGIINASEVAGATEGSITIALEAKLYKTNTAGVLSNEYNGTASFTNGEVTLWYKITATITGDGIEFSNADAQGDITAVKDRIALETFKMVFQATVA